MEKAIFTVNSNKAKIIINLLEKNEIPFNIDFKYSVSGVYKSKMNTMDNSDVPSILKKIKKKKSDNHYTNLMNYALQIGFKSVSDAILKLGKNKFMNDYKKEYLPKTTN